MILPRCLHSASEIVVECKCCEWHIAGMAKKTAKSAAAARRSPCPVACSLDILGDRWTLLVIRDLLFGRTRFKEFSASPEGIPTNILSERLVRLQQHEIVDQIPALDGTKRLAYKLTAKGRALVRCWRPCGTGV